VSHNQRLHEHENSTGAQTNHQKPCMSGGWKWKKGKMLLL
jgi:hypothetical protein